MRTSTNRFRLFVKVTVIGIFLSVVSAAMFAQNNLTSISELHKINHVYCLTDKPFTGTAVKHYFNGQKSVQKEFVKGILNGKTVEWYISGQKKLTSAYVNGVLEGVTTFWYKNGVKESESHFLNGKRNGFVEYWNSDGIMTESNTYVNGKLSENIG